MAGKAEIKLDDASMKSALGILDQIDEMVRGPAITQVLRSVGTQIKNDVRAVLPKPGYPGDKPQFKPLRDSLKVKVKNYDGGAIKVMITGYEWPAGAHGQPLEAGHEKVLWGRPTGEQVDPHAFLGDVVRSGQASQSRQLIEGARKVLARIKAKG
jgi:hypothetical protein